MNRPCKKCGGRLPKESKYETCRTCRTVTCANPDCRKQWIPLDPVRYAYCKECKDKQMRPYRGGIDEVSL